MDRRLVVVLLRIFLWVNISGTTHAFYIPINPSSSKSWTSFRTTPSATTIPLTDGTTDSSSPRPTQKLLSPISLDFDDLTKSLQRGVGRSRAVWECYRVGIDPLLYFDPTIPDEQLDDSVHSLLSTTTTTTMTEDDNQGSNIHPRQWSREELRLLFRSKRKNQGLGQPTLDLLEQIGGKKLDTSGSSIATATAELPLSPPPPAAVITTRRRGIEDSIATISHISVANDGTTKLLIHLVQDGLEVETVIIPWSETGRSTLCISSQVGCAQACRFCATGKMGRLRNLSSDEICAQVFLARKVCRVLDLYPVDGLVFMGMGEPA